MSTTKQLAVRLAEIKRYQKAEDTVVTHAVNPDETLIDALRRHRVAGKLRKGQVIVFSDAETIEITKISPEELCRHTVTAETLAHAARLLAESGSDLSLGGLAQECEGMGNVD